MIYLTPKPEELDVKWQVAQLLEHGPAPIVRAYDPAERNVTVRGIDVAMALRAVSASASWGCASAAVPAYSKSPFPALFSKIDRLGELEDNWDGDGAEAPNATAQFRAKKILTSLMRASLVPRRISASVEDGIGFAFAAGNRYADIECSNDGTIMAVKSNGAGEHEIWAVTPDDIDDAVEKIREFMER